MDLLHILYIPAGTTSTICQSYSPGKAVLVENGNKHNNITSAFRSRCSHVFQQKCRFIQVIYFCTDTPLFEHSICHCNLHIPRRTAINNSKTEIAALSITQDTQGPKIYFSHNIESCLFRFNFLKLNWQISLSNTQS